MRYKKQILFEYLKLLNEENKLRKTDEQMYDFLKDEENSKSIERKLKDELYVVEKLDDGQLVNSERAFYIFCKVIIYKDVASGSLIWNTFVKKQFGMVERHKSVCYMAHRGSGKSYFLALYAIFKMFLIDNFYVCYCSNVPRQKKRWLKTVRSLIDANELLLEKKDSKRVAMKAISWGNEELEYNHGLLEGTTVGTTPRGGHYNLVMGDDPLRDDRKYTREFTLNYFQGVLKPTTYRKKARYVIVGTPQDGEDLFHTLMNDKLDKQNKPIGKIVSSTVSYAGFYSNIFPAVVDEETKEILIPSVWTYEALMKEKETIGDVRFQREMMCRCTSFKNAMIGLSLFRKCCDEKLSFLQKGEPSKKYIVSVDSATSDAPSADYSSMAVWEDDERNDKFILRHLFHVKGMPITDPYGQDCDDCDQAHKLHQLHRDFNRAIIVVERNNAGIALIQATKSVGERAGMPVDIIEHYTHQTSSVREGKIVDITSYISAMKNDVIVFPSNPDDFYSLESLEKLKNEHLNFGVKQTRNGEKYQALAGHDDIFDSCWLGYKFRGDSADTIPFGITLSGM